MSKISTLLKSKISMEFFIRLDLFEDELTYDFWIFIEE